MIIAQDKGAMSSHGCSSGLKFKTVMIPIKKGGKPNSLVETHRDHTSTISLTRASTGVEKNLTNQSAKHYSSV